MVVVVVVVVVVAVVIVVVVVTSILVVVTRVRSLTVHQSHSVINHRWVNRRDR